MGGSAGWPDYQVYIEQCLGYPLFDGGSWNALGAASNVVVGANPPYSLTDFFGFFPKFAGPIATTQATFTQGAALLAVVNTADLAVGQPVAVLNVTPSLFPTGTTIAAVNAVGQGNNGQITLSQPVNQSGTFTLTVYVGPPLVPFQVVNAYIALASASLVQARWQDTWLFAMALYAAHFATLYLRSEGNCSTSCGQAAVAGLKSGITIAQSAGGVSQSLKPVPGIDDWGQWGMTSYGAQLCQFAASIGAGCMWLY